MPQQQTATNDPLPSPSTSVFDSALLPHECNGKTVKRPFLPFIVFSVHSCVRRCSLVAQQSLRKSSHQQKCTSQRRINSFVIRGLR